MDKKVLLVGGGGREHALAWKISQSPNLGKLYTAPGNAGTGLLGENVPIKATDVPGLMQFALDQQIDITVVGQDDPLAMGIVDQFSAQGLRIFGPTSRAAQIEASKVFAKKLMVDAQIPTAKFMVFKKEDYELACQVVRYLGTPVVVKASGLALGKGAYVCITVPSALDALHNIMVKNVHGHAGDEAIIEEYLPGKEFSIHAFSDGTSVSLFPPARDHKSLFNRGQGPNTGGMGVFAPVPMEFPQWSDTKQIVEKAIRALRAEESPFVGLLYPGLKYTPNMHQDGLKVLEFNARFGDPETQVYMPLLKTDILDIFEACIDGKLDRINVEWNPGYAVCVVLASEGYPSPNYKKGVPITGISDAKKIPGVGVFYAGATVVDDVLQTSGGRVLGVVGTGESLEYAVDNAYAGVHRINFEGMQYRTDIGRHVL